MTPQQAHALVTAMTPEQQARLGEVLHDLAAWIEKHGPTVDQAITELGRRLADDAEQYANWEEA